MAIEMKVPSVGESVSEVTIASWTKKDGDLVKMDEVICELESDKATFELPAEADGILRIVAPEGTTLLIGALICKIETTAQVAATPVAVVETPKAESQPVAAVVSKVIDVIVPAVGESISEITIAAWSKKDGDSVKMDEVICELESDKATFELPSPENGVLAIVAQAGQVVPIGGIVAKITVGGAAESQPAVSPVPQASATPVASDSSYAAGHPSPVAAKVLAEKGIDATSVKGTGIGGRITKDDAMKAEKPATPALQPVSKPAAVTPQATAPKGDRVSRREKMTSVR